MRADYGPDSPARRRGSGPRRRSTAVATVSVMGPVRSELMWQAVARCRRRSPATATGSSTCSTSAAAPAATPYAWPSSVTASRSSTPAPTPSRRCTGVVSRPGLGAPVDRRARRHGRPARPRAAGVLRPGDVPRRPRARRRSRPRRWRPSRPSCVPADTSASWSRDATPPSPLVPSPATSRRRRRCWVARRPSWDLAHDGAATLRPARGRGAAGRPRLRAGSAARECGSSPISCPARSSTRARCARRAVRAGAHPDGLVGLHRTFGWSAHDRPPRLDISTTRSRRQECHSLTKRPGCSHQLEQSLAAEDPDFASTLRGSKFMAHNRRVAVLAALGFIAGLVVHVRRRRVQDDLARRHRLPRDGRHRLPVQPGLEARHRRSRRASPPSRLRRAVASRSRPARSSTAWRSAGSAAATATTSSLSATHVRRSRPTSLHHHTNRPLGGGFSLCLDGTSPSP